MRLDKFLSQAGIGTRKEVKILIKKGFVSLDDTIIKQVDYDFNPYSTIVKLNDKIIEYQPYYYFVLNKPEGYVSACNDNLYPTVIELIEGYDHVKLSPVGRLDVDTTGTLLITNDGNLHHRLIAPKYHVDKKYYVETDFKIPQDLILAFKNGIMLDGELTLPGELEIIDDKKAYLTIHQGKFHQVKRMFQNFNLKVLKLDRVSFAFLNHDNLKLGEYRTLTKDEVDRLKKLVESKENNH